MEQTQNPVDIPSSRIVATNVSFQDFLTQFSEQHAEWLMGEVIVYVSNNRIHQLLLALLTSLLHGYLGFKPLGELFIAGFPMHIADDVPAREPDLLIVFNKHLDRVQSTYLDGAADIVVEIVSPESGARDREQKFEEYQAAGIGEYWLLDPVRQAADIYILTAVTEGWRYRRAPLDEHGRLISSLLRDFALDLALLWREKLPKGDELFKLVHAMIETEK